MFSEPAPKLKLGLTAFVRLREILLSVFSKITVDFPDANRQYLTDRSPTGCTLSPLRLILQGQRAQRQQKRTRMGFLRGNKDEKERQSRDAQSAENTATPSPAEDSSNASSPAVIPALAVSESEFDQLVTQRYGKVRSAHCLRHFNRR
jgi:hypothetical protein